MRHKTKKEILESKAVSEWASKSRKLFKGRVPKSRADASRRFKCNKLSGGSCELKGESCAKRHLSAVATVSKIRARPDWQCKLVRSDDLTCATCPAGYARAELIDLGGHHPALIRVIRDNEKDDSEELIIDLDW